MLGEHPHPASFGLGWLLAWLGMSLGSSGLFAWVDLACLLAWLGLPCLLAKPVFWLGLLGWLVKYEQTFQS